MFQITGTLKVKGNEQAVSEKFRKREFVITDNSSQYPQHISMQLTQDRCPIINDINVGEEITVAFNLRGREWTSPQGEVKYFNSLEAWKIDRKQNASASAAPAASENVPHPSVEDLPVESKDDLPF